MIRENTILVVHTHLLVFASSIIVLIYFWSHRGQPTIEWVNHLVTDTLLKAFAKMFFLKKKLWFLVDLWNPAAAAFAGLRTDTNVHAEASTDVVPSISMREWTLRPRQSWPSTCCALLPSWPLAPPPPPLSRRPAAHVPLRLSNEEGIIISSYDDGNGSANSTRYPPTAVTCLSLFSLLVIAGPRLSHFSWLATSAFVCLAGKWIGNAARPRNGLFSNPEPLSHMTETKSVKRWRRGYVLAFSVQLSLHQSRRTLEPGLSGPCCCRVAYLSLCRFILVGVRVGWQRFPLQRVRLANNSTSGCKGEEAQVTK